MFLALGEIPVIPVLISIGVALPVMILGLGIGLKYGDDDKFMHKLKNALYVLIGISVLISGIVIIIDGGNTHDYTLVGFGLLFVFYYLYKKSKTNGQR